MCNSRADYTFNNLVTAKGHILFWIQFSFPNVTNKVSILPRAAWEQTSRFLALITETACFTVLFTQW